MRYQVDTPASTVYYDRNRIIFRNENRPGPYMLIPVYWSFLFLRSPKTAVPVLARPRAREVGRESCLHSIRALHIQRAYFYREIALHRLGCLRIYHDGELFGVLSQNLYLYVHVYSEVSELAKINGT